MCSILNPESIQKAAEQHNADTPYVAVQSVGGYHFSVLARFATKYAGVLFVNAIAGEASRQGERLVWSDDMNGVSIKTAIIDTREA